MDMSTLKDIKDNLSLIEGIWEFINKLYEEGKIILIKELEEEIKKGDDKDFLKKEFIKDKKIIDEKKTQDFIDSYKEVVSNLPEDITENSIKIEKLEKGCDFYLVVYAYFYRFKRNERNVFILTNERKKGNQLKIPYIAEFSGCECVDFTQFLEKEEKKVKLVDL